MSFIVFLPHIRRTFREAYVQKMALLSTPDNSQFAECGYKLSSEKELGILLLARRKRNIKRIRLLTPIILRDLVTARATTNRVYHFTKILQMNTLGQAKQNVCLRKSGWTKKSPPGRQGIHFFSPIFQNIHTN